MPFINILKHCGKANLEDREDKGFFRHTKALPQSETVYARKKSRPGTRLQPEDRLMSKDCASVAIEIAEGPEELPMSKKDQALMKVLTEMTQAQIQVAQLCYGKGKTQEEAATILGISARGVRYHLAAIDKKMKKHGI